jgi:hypothetical protein
MVLKISYILSKLLCEHGIISKKENRVLNIIKQINHYWNHMCPLSMILNMLNLKDINEIKK